MDRTTLLQQLVTYKTSPYTLKEEHQTVQQFIDFVQSQPNCFERSNVGHVTGSIWIVNKDQNKILLTHHKKLNMWLQLGGHADGDYDIKAVALKEAHEESGITDFTFLIPDIFDIDIHPITNACTYHYDVRFLLQANTEQFIVSDESHDLAWIESHKLADVCSERSVLRMQQKFELYQRGTSLPTPKLSISHTTSPGNHE